MYTPHKMRRRI